MVKASNNKLCSVCGHRSYIHEKWDGTENKCKFEGLNDATHTFASSTETLWDSGVPFEIPEPILYVPVENHVIDYAAFTSSGTWTGTEGYADDFAGVANGAVELDGTSDFITLTNEAKYDFERTDKHSIAFWFKAAADPAGSEAIFGKAAGVAAGDSGYLIGFLSDSSIFYVLKKTATTDEIVSGTTNVGFADGTWHHCMMTYDGSNNAAGVLFYIDGIVETTNVITDNLASSILNNAEVVIGSVEDGAIPFDGQLSELTVWDRQLSSAQASYIYNSGSGRRLGFNLRTGLLLYNKFNGNLTDETGDNTVTVGAGTEQYAVGLPTVDDNNAQAFDFDNSTRLDSDNEGTFDFTDTSKFTVSAWFKLLNDSLEQTVVCKTDAKGNTDNGWALYVHSGNLMRFKIMDGSGNALQTISLVDVTKGEWHHAVGRYDGTQLESGMDLWLDGVKTANVSATAVTAFVNNFNLTIGAESDTGTTTEGQIMHVAVWNRELSDAEITHLFNNGTPRDF